MNAITESGGIDRRAVLPDGRILRAQQDEPTGNWLISIDRDPKGSWEGRWLLLLLYDALGLKRHVRQQQAIDLAAQLSGFDTPAGRRYRCPCCDYLTLTSAPTGTHQTCPVCRWEDDAQQYEYIDQDGGANSFSLRQARENFERYGVSDLRSVENVRSPKPEEARQ